MNNTNLLKLKVRVSLLPKNIKRLLNGPFQESICISMLIAVVASVILL